MPSLVNETLIVLIPKISNPTKLAHYRPISLCNVSYKLVTKIIVNRIKDFLPSIIAPTQSSFVPRRQITDNIVIVQEVLHTMKSKYSGKGMMAIKLDLEKAYDRLNWDFLRETLLDIGIPADWTSLIMHCTASNAFRLCWNGDITDVFLPSRGIRQGDPLSPYLFVMCIERLSHLINEAVNSNQ